ncbi:MAG TPA: AAA family ATPase [Polyangia bacterium]|nr:AAA family ATPase [Polyangia bacterium]
MSSRRTFVGRARELDDVASAFDDAHAGRGALFLLVGGAGIGKTRLGDELSRRAEERGLQALWGRCWETGGAPAYWPWIQILRALAHDRSPAELRAAAGAGADAVAQLVPELGAPAGEGGGPGAAGEPDPTQARFRLFDALTAVLRAAARTRPLFLVLDDLHTADPSSLALLHFLARNLRGLRALVVGAYRGEEARLSPEVGQILGDIAREGSYLPLSPLSRAETEQLVARFTGAPPAPGLLDAVQRATEGNPLFLDELLRLLLQRGEIGDGSVGAAGGGEPAGVAGLPVPDTVREVIRRRVARLAPETRDLLALASVVGRDVGLPALAALAGVDAAGADLGARLESAGAANLLVPVDRTHLRFSHVLVRETLYRDLPAARRAELHLQVAALLEARGDGEALTEIAHHRLAALPAGDAAAAAAAARRAAERAAAMLAFEDAAALLEQARARLEEAGRIDPADACDLRLGAGLAFMRAGQADRGRQLCGAAADEARRLGDGARLARAALGYGAELMLALNDGTLIALLEEAMAMLPPGPSGARAQVMARLAAARMPGPDVLGPMAMARAAVEMARAAGAEPEVLRAVLYFAGSALADYGEPVERAAVSEEMIALARAAGDKVQMLRGECRLVFDYLSLGEIDKSLRAVDAYEALAREFRQPRHLWPAYLMRSMFAMAQGREAEARRLTQEARTLAAVDRDPATAMVFAWHDAVQVVTFERAEDADRALAEIARSVRIPGYELIAEVMVAICQVVLCARFSDDLAELRTLVAGLPWEIPYLTIETSIGASLAEAVARAGDRTLAELLHERLRPDAQRIANSGRSGFGCFGPIERGLGMLAGALGRHDQALAHLSRAIAQSERCGFALFAADGRCWQAEILLARGAAGDRERAVRDLDQVELVARTLELPRLAARAGALRARMTSAMASAATQAPPAPAPVSSPSGVRRAPSFTLVRESDYWTISSDDGTARVRDSRGMQMLDELIRQPGRELHALALMCPGGEAPDGGDAGEMIDDEAIADYRERLAELDAELAEAEGWADSGRAARARAEREAIAQELARGVGLGGRVRRAGAAAERARVNVQRRIRGAIRKIGESLPDLGSYLDRAVKTGTFCSYEPF